MPSRLRLQEDFDPISTGTIRPNFTSSQPPQKKQKMSLTQTYFVASSARAKLGKEACRPDHNLRLLVGHANLLDALMLELQDAEREQEAWFNRSLEKARKTEEPKKIQWLDQLQEEEDEEDSDDAASDVSDSDSEFDEEDFEMLPLKRLRSPPVTVTSTELEEDEEEDIYEDTEDASELALTRTQSHSSHPPELIDDSDSDDESLPPSPPQPTMDIIFDEKNNPLSQSDQAAFFDDGFFIPERNAPMIAAC
jgi:hypothetical protein